MHLDIPVQENQVYKDTLRKRGESYYILVDQAMLDYLGIKDPDNATLAIKAEKSTKWGNYFGVGVNKLK